MEDLYPRRDRGEIERFQDFLKGAASVVAPISVANERHEHLDAARWHYTMALYGDPGATLDDVREAAATLEEIERTARRVLGGAHPLTKGIEHELRNARAALRTRETPPPSLSPSESA